MEVGGALVSAGVMEGTELRRDVSFWRCRAGGRTTMEELYGKLEDTTPSRVMRMFRTIAPTLPIDFNGLPLSVNCTPPALPSDRVKIESADHRYPLSGSRVICELLLP